MSSGTIIKADLYIYGLFFRDEEDVRDHIKEVTSSMENIKSKLKMHAISTPKDIYTDSEEDVIFRVNADVDDLLEYYDEQLILLTKLEFLLSDFGNKEEDR